MKKIAYDCALPLEIMDEIFARCASDARTMAALVRLDSFFFEHILRHPALRPATTTMRADVKMMRRSNRLPPTGKSIWTELVSEISVSTFVAYSPGGVHWPRNLRKLSLRLVMASPSLGALFDVLPDSLECLDLSRMSVAHAADGWMLGLMGVRWPSSLREVSLPSTPSALRCKVTLPDSVETIRFADETGLFCDAWPTNLREVRFAACAQPYHRIDRLPDGLTRLSLGVNTVQALTDQRSRWPSSLRSLVVSWDECAAINFARHDTIPRSVEELTLATHMDDTPRDVSCMPARNAFGQFVVPAGVRVLRLGRAFDCHLRIRSSEIESVEFHEHGLFRSSVVVEPHVPDLRIEFPKSGVSTAT